MHDAKLPCRDRGDPRIHGEGLGCRHLASQAHYVRRLGSLLATAQSPKFRRVADPVVVFVVHSPARERQRYKSIPILVTEKLADLLDHRGLHGSTIVGTSKGTEYSETKCKGVRRDGVAVGEAARSL